MKNRRNQGLFLLKNY